MIATAGVVPLVLMVIALVVFQFDTQRRALLEELEDQAVEHNILLNNVIKTVEDHIWRLGAWSEIYGTREEARPPPVLPGEERRQVGGGIVLHGGGFTSRGDAAADYWLAENLIPHMRLSHKAMPYLRWSYFRSGPDDLRVTEAVEEEAPAPRTEASHRQR